MVNRPMYVETILIYFDVSIHRRLCEVCWPTQSDLSLEPPPDLIDWIGKSKVDA